MYVSGSACLLTLFLPLSRLSAVLSSVATGCTAAVLGVSFPAAFLFSFSSFYLSLSLLSVIYRTSSTPGSLPPFLHLLPRCEELTQEMHTSKYEHACARSHLHNYSPYSRADTGRLSVLISAAGDEELSNVLQRKVQNRRQKCLRGV